MITTKQHTETYILTDLDRLDPVTVYVTNYNPGQGKIVIECYGESWANYWGGMSGQKLQKFFIGCNNDYILHKLLDKTTQTDFDKIELEAKEKGFDICATNDVEVAMMAASMSECFGQDWFMDLPTCNTEEYKYVSRIIDAIKAAFQAELNEVA